MHLSGIQAEQVPAVWPSVIPLLNRSLEYGHGEHTVDTLLDEVMNRRMQLWVGHEDGEICYAALSMLTVYPTGRKVAEVTHMGGHDILNALEEHTRRFEDWARDQGCNAVSIVGRNGWRKIHPEYDVAYTKLVREL